MLLAWLKVLDTNPITEPQKVTALHKNIHGGLATTYEFQIPFLLHIQMNIDGAGSMNSELMPKQKQQLMMCLFFITLFCRLQSLEYFNSWYTVHKPTSRAL